MTKPKEHKHKKKKSQKIKFSEALGTSKKSRRRKKKGDEWEIDEGSDHPVHEKYVKEEPVKE